MSAQQRTSGAAIGKIATAAAGVLLAGAALGNAASNVTTEANPALALRINGNNAQALGDLASVQVVSNGGDRSKLIEARAMALRSVAAQPLNPVAIRTVAMVDAMMRGPEAALRPMTATAQQSRRDTLTQMWMMSRSIGRGDLRTALVHFDAAARVSPESWQILFPPLIYALNDTRVATLFEPYLSENNPWMGEFIRQSVRLSDRPDVIAAILAQGKLPRTREFGELTNELVRRLIYSGRFASAEALFRSQRGNDQSVLTDARLVPGTTAAGFTPIRWLLDVEDGASLDASEGEASPRIYVVIRRGVTGLSASKYVSVRPGTYHFSASGEYLRPPAGAEFRWRVRCWNGTAFAIIWRSETLVTERHSVSGDVVVPNGCAGALIELEAKGPANDADAEYMAKAVRFDRTT